MQNLKILGYAEKWKSCSLHIPPCSPSSAGPHPHSHPDFHFSKRLCAMGHLLFTGTSWEGSPDPGKPNQLPLLEITTFGALKGLRKKMHTNVLSLRRVYSLKKGTILQGEKTQNVTQIQIACPGNKGNPHLCRLLARKPVGSGRRDRREPSPCCTSTERLRSSTHGALPPTASAAPLPTLEVRRWAAPPPTCFVPVGGGRERQGCCWSRAPELPNGANPERQVGWCPTWGGRGAEGTCLRTAPGRPPPGTEPPGG